MSAASLNQARWSEAEVVLLDIGMSQSRRLVDLSSTHGGTTFCLSHGRCSRACNVSDQSHKHTH